MLNRKLKAFTLIEIIVSLTIASIVMLLASYGFNTIVSMGDKMKSGLSDSESSYFLLSDIEKQFNSEGNLVVQFNDVIFKDVSFECGVEMIVRKQSGRIDTIRPVITSPNLYLATANQNSDYPLMDKLIFTAGEASYDLIRQGSLAENINQRIGNGED